MSDPKSTHALILSGGGAHGAFEVGVIKALLKGESPGTQGAPLDPTILCGTSVGSFNAAFLASRAESASAIDELQSVWLDQIAESPERGGNGVFRFRGNPLPLLDPRWITREPLAPFARMADDSRVMLVEALRRAGRVAGFASLEQWAVELFDLSSLVSTDPFARLLERTLPLEAVRRSRQDLRVVATCWETGTSRIFANQHLTDELGHAAILASSALPGIFAPVTLEGKHYVDGGLLMNTPLKPAIDAGADVLHIVYLDPEIRDLALEKRSNTLDALDRALTIQFAASTNRDLEMARAINQGLDLIAGASARPDARAFTRAASRLKQHESTAPYKKLTVHRYSPTEDLGGVLSLLNFNRSRIEERIERGVAVGKAHDCRASGCVLP